MNACNTTRVTHQGDSVGKEGHSSGEGGEEGGLAGLQDGVGHTEVGVMQGREVHRLPERVEEDKHVVNSNPDNDKDGDNIKNSNTLDVCSERIQATCQPEDQE